MKILLANPRGFCAGVDRAISTVERALELFGAPIYVRHEVVHNRYVVDGLRDRGAIFVEELHEVPDDCIVIFSAHGIAKSVRDEAVRRNLKFFDATCPLVSKVHMEVTRASRQHVECVLVGHAGHPEVMGTMGQYESDRGGIYLVESIEDVAGLEVKDPEKLVYSTQTTLSLDDSRAIIGALKEKFPAIRGPRKDDICYATTNRQDAVRDLAEKTDMVLVVGSRNSSNSNRLREKAETVGTRAYLIDGADDIDTAWIEGAERIGVTAGASAPEILVEQVIDRLKQLGGVSVAENEGREENTSFGIPVELRVKTI